MSLGLAGQALHIQQATGHIAPDPFDTAARRAGRAAPGPAPADAAPTGQWNFLAHSQQRARPIRRGAGRPRALSVCSRTHELAHLQPHLTPGQNAITDGHKSDRSQHQDQGWRGKPAKRLHRDHPSSP